ncbi:MAG: hypothetical protein LBT37_03475 [Lactobacillaceae bacterium]|jgi:hypothetical protein|nr:hypothetical protein [Lactobacillaceae bacterium]
MNKVTRILVSALAVGVIAGSSLISVATPFVQAADVPTETVKYTVTHLPADGTFAETASDGLTALNVNDPIIAPLNSIGGLIKIKVTDASADFNFKIVGKSGDQVLNYVFSANDLVFGWDVLYAYPVDEDTPGCEINNNSVNFDDGSVKNLKPEKEYSIYIYGSSFFDESVDNLEIYGSNIDFTVSKYVASQASYVDIF